MSAARWMNDAESSTLRAEAIRTGDTDRYLKLTDARAGRVRVRRRLAFAGLLTGAAGLLVLHTFAPTWLVLALALVAVLVLGVVGTPADRPVTGRSVVRTEVQRLTSEIVVRALSALGLAEINKAMGKGGGGITFPAPITRDGPGWRAA